MPNNKKETWMFFEHGDDEIQIRSWDKKLNAAIRKMKAEHPETVWIRANDDDEPGFLWCAVKMENFVFYPVPPMSEKGKRAQSENGKRHAGNLKNNVSRTKIQL